MSLQKKPTTLRQFIAHFLVFGLVLSSSLITSGQSQDRTDRQRREGGQRGGSIGRGSQDDHQEHGFVTYGDGEKSVCRDMNENESRMLQRDPEQVRQLRVITAAERQEALRDTNLAPQNEGVNGLTIILRSTPQLDGFPAAKDAFIRAAAQWEAQIRNPISIIIDVDYGPNRFGSPYPSGVLGSTSTPTYAQSLDTVRARLVNGAGSAAETNLYNSLPTGTINTDIGNLSNVSVAAPLMRAFGLLPADAASGDTAPSIGFNSAFAFDFDPSDGITSNQTDFDAVAVHEMGHALGFISRVGSGSTALSVWDMFRFRPGTTLSTFTTAQRIQTTGGEHRFFDGNPELACSTGGPSGTGGDGRQASHWKADEQTGGNYIGIMDPTIAAGVRQVITSNDLRMLESIGYTISGTLPTPCTYSLSAANGSFDSSGGTGSVNVDASTNSCTWTAVSNASWITVTSGASGTGDGTVNFSVAPTTGGNRSGTITIGGQTFTVNQTGCSFIVSFPSASFPSTATTRQITVTLNGSSGANCGWTASDNRNWITLSPTSGTGNGTVNITVSSNSNRNSRTGTVTVAGSQITITQAGR